MKKVRGIFFAAAVLSVLLMVSLVIAAPPGSQPPSSGLLVPAFSDIGPVSARADNLSHPNVAPLSGDVISIHCDYFVSGCFEQKAFSNRIDIDDILYYEEERYWLPPGHGNPNCYNENRKTSASFSRTWTATPGSHTIKCWLDSKDNMAEGPQNELNNKKSITVNVPQSDKIIKDIKTKQPIPVPVPRTR